MSETKKPKTTLLDIDAIEGIDDPVEIRLNGKLRPVITITAAHLKRFTEMEKAAQEDEGAIFDVLTQELAILLDCNPEEFKGMSIRKIRAAIRQIMQTTQERDEKNG